MQSLAEIQKQCLSCRKCALADTRKSVVFGSGREDAEIVFIGEGPGEQEDIQGLPFVGPAGQLLDDMLKIIYLSREDVYIANIVKCRPPKNRDPLNTEQDACREWLGAQLDTIRPKIVVCLGRVAATALIRPDFRITREHGQWFDMGGVQYTAIYHPAALLRDEGKRPETFVDLKRLEAKIKEICTKTY